MESLNKKLELVNIFDDSVEVEMRATRDGFGLGLVDAADRDDMVLGVCADLAESTRMHWFKEKYPDRYIEVGVAEQNLATVSSGLASVGFKPYMASYAAFSPGRNFEQIRTTIALNEMPVKVIGCHSGVSVGPDGATHQALEDIGLMRMLPNMMVFAPCDAEQARKVTDLVADLDSPVYIRLARAKSPVVTTEKTPFEVGKAYRYLDYEMPDVSVFVTGNLIYEAMMASRMAFEKNGVRANVVAFPTIKPLDLDVISEEVEKVDAIVTVEEHQIAGGFGSAVAEVVDKRHSVLHGFVGVNDKFGQSGNKDELYKYYGLDIKSVYNKIMMVYNMLNS